MSSTIEADPRVEALLRDAARHRAEPLARRDRIVEGAGALALALAIAAIAVLVPGGRRIDPGAAAALGAVYVLAKTVRFRVGGGTLSPTEPVLFAAVLLLPPAAAVLLIVTASIVARVPEYLGGRLHVDHVLLVFGDAWHAIAPALVIGLLAPGDPSLDAVGIYALALVAQFALDTAAGVTRAWLALGVPPALQLRLLGLVYSVDAALAPIGLLLAVCAVGRSWALLLVLPLLGLLSTLGREREKRIEHALQLSEAYRGSALLMGEMLEADDEYTGGEHSKGVVVLALTVGRELGLDARDQRQLEFGALLHDIGKLRTPDEIINKPGKLTPEEWTIIKRHPEDGQAMLDRIGGVLADVGLIVRHHHERWDGNGYPDGIAAHEIPLAARIICACDAYSAMTTNRSYRAAMPVAEAIAELRACAGSQFDRRVVEALVSVVEREAPAPLSALLAA